jgi:hypothetical protein
MLAVKVFSYFIYQVIFESFNRLFYLPALCIGMASISTATLLSKIDAWVTGLRSGIDWATKALLEALLNDFCFLKNHLYL